MLCQLTFAFETEMSAPGLKLVRDAAERDEDIIKDLSLHLSGDVFPS